MEKKIRILCIDDDVQIRFAFSALCESQGWIPEVVCNVTEAKKVFSEKEIDLVLIDYHLPGTNGIEGVKMLRRKSMTVPIIVFTIDENQEIADSFLKAGANDFALKPMKALDMISRIKLHIRLMEQEKNLKEPAIEQKGIAQATKNLVLQYLEKADKPLTAGEIAKSVGLANQTVYRYLQFLVGENQVMSETIYGKTGRPKQKFYIDKKKKAEQFLERYENAQTEDSQIFNLYNAIGVWVGFDKIAEYVSVVMNREVAESLVKSVKALQQEGDKENDSVKVTITSTELRKLADELEREVAI